MMLSQIDLTGVPPPSGGITQYWPAITIGISLMVGGVSAVWTAWVSVRTKRLESEHDEKMVRSEKVLELETEKMKLEFARQKEFQDDLMGQCRELMNECQNLRNSLHEANGNIMERDARIKAQAAEIIELQRQITELKTQIEALRKHVEALEEKNKVH